MKSQAPGWVVAILLGIALCWGGGVAAQEERQPAEKAPAKAATAQEEKETKKKKEAEEQAEAEAVEEVRVVAPPLIEGNHVNRLGSQVTTVGRDQIHDLNATDLPSALRRTPGVTISRYNLVGGFGGAQGGAIYIRGMGSGRPGAEIVTMVDGVPKFVGVWTHPLLDTLSVNIADSIDVYKGAQPVLFGPMTYGAVNIHTKRRTTPGFETRVESAGGKFGTWYEVAEHGGKIGPFDYYIVESYRGSSGHRPKANGKVEEWFGRVGLDIGKYLNLSFTVQHSDAWAKDPGRDYQAPPDREKFKVMDTTYMWTLTNEFDKARGYLKVYFDDGDIDWEHHKYIQRPGYPGAVRYYESQTDWHNAGIRVQEKIEPWKGGEVVIGLDYDSYGGRFEEDCAEVPSGFLWYPGSERFHNVQPYFAVSHMFGSKDSWYVIPSAGVRLNLHNEFQDRWTPQAGIVVGYKDTEFHFYYARNVNYPGVYAIFQYQLWRMINNAGQDPHDIKPEIVDHFEYGLSHKFTDWLKADITAFHDRGKNAFSFVQQAPPYPPIMFYGDQKRWHSDGIELTATLTPNPDFAVFAGVTFLHARMEAEAMPNAPEVSFMSGLTWRFLERFQLNLDAQYISKQYKDNPRFPDDPTERERINGYFLMNGKVSCRVTPKDSKVQGTVFAYVENITSTSYELREDYPAPGTTYLIGGEIKF